MIPEELFWDLKTGDPVCKDVRFAHDMFAVRFMLNSMSVHTRALNMLHLYSVLGQLIHGKFSEPVNGV